MQQPRFNTQGQNNVACIENVRQMILLRVALGSQVATRFSSLPHPPLSLPLSPLQGLVSFVLMLRTIDVAHHLLNHQ